MKIEFILRESTIEDIIDNWTAMGNIDNSNDGGFVFENVEDYTIFDGGIIKLFANEITYIYNLSDFYRIKITE